MTDTSDTLSPIAIRDFLPRSSTAGRPEDESLLLHASSRWQQSQQYMLALTAGAPSVQASLKAFIREQLNLDGDSVQLHFAAAGDTPERYITLTQACAFVHQFPAHASLYAHCRVIGLPDDQQQYAAQPFELLKHFTQLNVHQALRSAWVSYWWFTRAPGTPVSRRDHAIAQYSSHFQAAAQWACASGSITADQLKPLLKVLDPPNGALQLDGQKVYTEQLLLKRAGHRDAELPGALVITLDTDIVLQLLYLPAQQPALQLFNNRNSMEQWLRDQTALFPGVTQVTDEHLIDYREVNDALQTGLTHLLEERLKQKQASLHYPHGRDLAEHGHRALEAADQVDRQHRREGFFAIAPSYSSEHDVPLGGHPMVFAGLTADLPLAQRRRVLAQQQEAFKAVQANDAGNERLSAIGLQLERLHEAQQQAHAAANALWDQPLVNLLELSQQANPNYHALLQARLKGLLAEASLQHQLAQISDAEHNMLLAVFDPLNAPNPELKVSVATLIVSTRERTNGERKTQSKELDGVLLITLEEALLDPSSPQDLLLYWPGSQGGLQRFDALKSVEQWLKVMPSNGSSLELALLNQTPFDYSLTAQLDGWVVKIEEMLAQAPDDTERQARELAPMRLQALQELGVPTHTARELAYAQTQEQHQSGALAGQLPAWLGQVAADDRRTLKALLEAYLQAFERAEEALELKLPLVSAFCKKHLDARLSRDFSLSQPFSIQLDLPESVSHQQHFVEAPGAPGTPTKTVLVPSATRVKMSLEALALSNIDPTISERLSFMKVEVRTPSTTQSQALATGLTANYLRRLVPELDLAQRYETLIIETYQGTEREADFTRAHRLECLLEPYRLMLKLQGRQALLQKRITASEWGAFDLAIDAGSPHIELLPAFLSVGGTDTADGPSTLSGITFIRQKNSGSTLLYLPDSPDGDYLRSYTNLEAARQALFNLCLSSKMVSYLAGRALLGTEANHISRINQAVLRHFDALIGVGVPWPATTSLAGHLLNAQMGRVIEAHRASSRSNSALFLEQYAVKGTQAFNYIKMALGVVPVVGTVIGVVDAWGSANDAVDAFRRGEHAQGMQHITLVLQSLIDAGVDVASGVLISPNAARAQTLGRQLRNAFKGGGFLQPPMSRKAQHVAERFKGYEYEKVIALAPLSPASHGLYRNIYRHADGDFIVRQGNSYRVELHNGHWRLSGNSVKTYKQPIALDEAGQWDTHFGVYGTAQPGGLAGGGGVLGHIADRLDPLWPLAIRRQLPVWWTDHVLRRQLALNSTINTLGSRLDTQLASTANLQRLNNQSDLATRKTLVPTLDQAYAKDIDLAIQHANAIDDVIAFSPAAEHLNLKGMQSRDAWIVTSRGLEQLKNAAANLEALTHQFNAVTLPEVRPDAVLHFLQTRKRISQNLLRELDRIDSAFTVINEWNNKINLRAQEGIVRVQGRDARKSAQQINQDVQETLKELGDVRNEAAQWNELYDPEFRLHLRTVHSIETFNRYDHVTEYSWLYLQSEVNRVYVDAHLALTTHYSLTSTTTTVSQRTRILNECIAAYERFSLSLKTLSAGYPQHFDLDNLGALLLNLERTRELALKRIGTASPVRRQPPNTPKGTVFETEDHRLLIGVKSTDLRTNATRYTVDNLNGRTETWELRPSGKAQRQAAPEVQPPPEANVKSVLVTEAQNRLQAVPTYQAKVDAYARQGMLPVDLEHMLVSEAAELTLRSNRIERLDPEDAIIEQLRSASTELTARGRTLRTQQSLASKKPTDGMLDDLVRQRVVDVRRTTPITELGRRPGGHRDFMQEYEAWDLTSTPPRPLWYAHFHYNRRAAPFDEFEKAHLKLPEHRYLTHADDPSLPFSDIGRQSAALTHIRPLWVAQ